MSDVVQKRVIALDIGDKRIGIAASDLSGTMAFPVDVLPAADVMNAARSWKRILEDHDPEILVIGLPISLSGEENAQAERIAQAAALISRGCGLPYEFTDERLSSAEAKRRMREAGVSEKQARGRIDMVAASLFLQAWLDARNARARQDMTDEEAR